jgi:hypothetical protein
VGEMEKRNPSQESLPLDGIIFSEKSASVATEKGTTIKISKGVRNRLEHFATYRDTMNSVVSRLLDDAEQRRDKK